MISLNLEDSLSLPAARTWAGGQGLVQPQGRAKASVCHGKGRSPPPTSKALALPFVSSAAQSAGAHPVQFANPAKNLRLGLVFS